MTAADDSHAPRSEDEVERFILDLVLELAPNPDAAKGVDDPRLVKDLEFHSLGLMELAFTLEDEFELDAIDEETALRIVTAGDVVRHVLRELALRTGAPATT